MESAGKRFRAAVAQENPLQIVGTINAMSALLAEEAGFRAIYLSGAGVANASYGLPDLGVTTLENVLIDVKRITATCQLPLLVDVDTGFSESGIEKTTTEMIRAGAAAMHMEDQVAQKRCGHREGKVIVKSEEMADRIRSAVSARTDPDFVIMARTDAVAIEGLEAAIDRANDYIAAGADMIFAEALTNAADYKTFTSNVSAPVLANMTEFGKSPLMDVQSLGAAGIRLILYPLTAFRSMNFAAANAFRELRQNGTQAAVIDQMQTRTELYEILGYHEAEKRIDQFLKQTDKK